MSIPFVSFRPASYHKGKDSFVYYYAVNPETEKLQRVKIRVNHIHKATDRDKYARLLCHTINDKLWAGWNPFAEKMAARAVTISEGIDKFLAVKQKATRKDTMRSYRSFCNLFLDYLREHNLARRYCFQVGREQLLQYLECMELNKDISNRSYNNYSAFLYTLFDFFVERGYIKENPAADLPRKRVDRKTRTVIPPKERARIREYFAEHTPNYIYVMMLCYRLFIRPKEIMMLRIGFIDFDSALLTIPSDIAKNHCDRVLGVPDEIMEYFRTLRDLPPEWYIFSDRNTYSPGPKQVAPTRIAERWAQMRDELKMPASYQFYSLKDTGITEMLEAGVPAKYVKELADHHSLEMTERYTHKSNAKVILEWNKLVF